MIDDKSEAFCTKHGVVVLSSAVDKCYCGSCEYMVIRKKIKGD